MSNFTRLNYLFEKSMHIFDELGIEYGKIKSIEVVKPHKWYGRCNRFVNNKSWKNCQYKIEINEDIFNYNDTEVLSIITHEIIHTCCSCYNHSTYFKAICKKINAKYPELKLWTHHSHNLEPTNYKFKLICPNCNQVYYILRGAEKPGYRCKCKTLLDVYDNNGNKRVIL